MKMYSSPRPSTFFKAVVPLVLLVLFLPCSPVLANNTHTATVNGTGGASPPTNLTSVGSGFDPGGTGPVVTITGADKGTLAATAVVNGNGTVNVSFTGSPTGTGNLTVTITQSVFNNPPTDLLITPNLGFSSEKNQFIQSLKQNWLKASEDLIAQKYGWTTNPSDAWNVTVNESDTGPYAATTNTSSSFSGVTDVIAMQFDLPDFTPPHLSPASLADLHVARQMVHVMQAQNSYYGDLVGDGTSSANWFKEGLASFIAGEDDRVYAILGPNPSDPEIDALLSAIGTGNESVTTSNQMAANYLAVRYLHNHIVSGLSANGIKHITEWMKTQFEAGAGPAASGITAYFATPGIGFPDNDAFISDFKGINGRNFVKTSIIPNLTNTDTGAIGGSDASGGASLDSQSVIPDATGGPSSSVNFEVDQLANVLAFSENQPVGTVVGEFNATDPDPGAVLTYSLSDRHVVPSAAGLEMLWVNPGTFTMGSPTNETGRDSDREDEHQVTLTKGFYLGKHEVTQAQYETVIGSNPSEFNATGYGNRPVEKVSWTEATAFCAQLTVLEQAAGRLPADWSYALPTEAEWEYACRAGTTTAYSWGNTIAAANANYWDSVYSQTQDVGQYAPNPWGFHDMHGNVWEWTNDWYQAAYPTGSVTDPTGPASGSSRIKRGGSWDYIGKNLRSSKRNFILPGDSHYSLGFRLALRYTGTAPDPGKLTQNHLFTLDANGTLKTATTFDFESNATTYSIRVRVTDEHNASAVQVFTIHITNTNSAPVITPPSTQPTDDNQTQTDPNGTAPAPGDPVVTLYRPLPKTLAQEGLANGNFRLWGIIQADGGSPITEVAFELADNMVFRNSTLHTATMLTGSPNFSVTLQLQPDKGYHYRAVATNSVGTTFGASKMLTTPPDQTQWWSDSVETTGGWRHSPWLGAFRPYDNGWIYHAKLGWAYAHPDGSRGLWLWFRNHRWMWTQIGVFPYLWKHDLGSWHYLLGTRNGQPVFYEWTGHAPLPQP